MKKPIFMVCLFALAFNLTGCNEESELDKAVKEGKEMNRKTSGVDREVPRVILTPNKPQQKNDTGEK
ncbi:hypothetical protein [Thiobacillus denitrificans]|uniref:hypothetical protein n=1 Tax=Thiobacillus denitrificans TaxID=36861 RepID=UPI00035F51A9|nr:hypothetical protein [Thiobacillus denitrificans]